MKKINELIERLEKNLLKMENATKSSEENKQPLNANYFFGCAEGLKSAIREIKEVNKSINLDVKNLL